MYSFLVTGIMKLFDINTYQKQKICWKCFFYVNRVIQIFYLGYVFNGAYTPLACKVVQEVIKAKSQNSPGKIKIMT